jgi:hypothetical protein
MVIRKIICEQPEAGINGSKRSRDAQMRLDGQTNWSPGSGTLNRAETHPMHAMCSGTYVSSGVPPRRALVIISKRGNLYYMIIDT